MHLLGFGTMYASAVSFMALWFQYINIKFPDPLNQYYSYGYEQLRMPMATLIILVPVFLFLSRRINREIAEEPSRKELRIYKWLVYLTLFISAVTVIIDLITLIYNFLGGDLTARFGLKVLVVLIVALGIFGYYLWHLRTDLATAKSKRKTLLWGTIVVTLGSIILGFFIVGSPATARARRYDQQRIRELQGIQYNIVNFWQLNQKLPAYFSDLQQSILDPESGLPYEYQVSGLLTFQLCATFKFDGILSEMVYPGAPQSEFENWTHPAGRYCFDRTIHPELYPKIVPAIPVR